MFKTLTCFHIFVVLTQVYTRSCINLVLFCILQRQVFLPPEMCMQERRDRQEEMEIKVHEILFEQESKNMLIVCYLIFSYSRNYLYLQ